MVQKCVNALSHSYLRNSVKDILKAKSAYIKTLVLICKKQKRHGTKKEELTHNIPELLLKNNSRI